MANLPKIALVGSETLLGREIKDIAATSAPELELRLVAAEEAHLGKLSLVGEEPTIVAGLDADSLAGVRAVFLAAAEEEVSRKTLELAEAESAAVIDLTYAAEEHADARLRAPSVESEPEYTGERIHVVAHPAAIALALFLRRLQTQDSIRRAVIQVLAPASELGQAGVEELQQQTVSLFSFQSMPKKSFDAQLSFNLLARYGEEAPAPLEHLELRIERHLATLLALPGDGEGAPMPSLRVAQAPVFHGYTFSAWVEFDSNPGVEALESSLACDWIDVRSGEFEPPTNVGQAGQGGISIGAIAEDRNCADACWFWFVADNLRLAAENAVAVAREML